MLSVRTQAHVRACTVGYGTVVTRRQRCPLRGRTQSAVCGHCGTCTHLFKPNILYKRVLTCCEPQGAIFVLGHAQLNPYTCIMFHVVFQISVEPCCSSCLPENKHKKQNPETGEPMETFRHTPVDKKMPVRTYERFSQVVSHLLQPNGRILVVSEWGGRSVKVRT